MYLNAYILQEINKDGLLCGLVPLFHGYFIFVLNDHVQLSVSPSPQTHYTLTQRSGA